MAFVRRVRTASGATAVQIAEYVAGRQRIVAHVGSAHTEAELGVLLERARELLVDPAQGVLEFPVDPVPRVTALVRPAEVPGLFDGPRPPAGVRDGVGRVLSTDSRVLYEALAGVYADLGFDVLGDAVFADLVIARVVEPTSLRDAGRVLTDLGRRPASYATMKRTLARAGPQGGYRDRVASACFAHAAASGDITLCLYDVTTLYFEAEKEDDLRRVGYSKERRVDPQIVVGLLVDRGGFPLEIGCFAGNQAETATIIPIITAFQARHRVADMVVVADAGMLSAGNLRKLDEAGLRFIVGSRVTKAPRSISPATSTGTVTHSPTGRSSTPSPPKPATTTRTTRPYAPNRPGTRTPIPARGARSGPTPTNEPCATGAPSPRRSNEPAPPSTGRKRPGLRGSSKPATGHRPSIKLRWTAPADWWA